jgi:hypothetical protein
MDLIPHLVFCEVTLGCLRLGSGRILSASRSGPRLGQTFLGRGFDLLRGNADASVLLPLGLIVNTSLGTGRETGSEWGWAGRTDGNAAGQAGDNRVMHSLCNRLGGEVGPTHVVVSARHEVGDPSHEVVRL